MALFYTIRKPNKYAALIQLFIQRVGKLKFDHRDFQLTIKASEGTFILIRQSAIKSKLHALRVLLKFA